MAALRNLDDDEGDGAPRPRSFGSFRLSRDVEVYALGICHASVCSPADLPVGDLLLIVNRECPTGISTIWQVDDAELFASGHPNPTTCENDPARIHRLLVC